MAYTAREAPPERMAVLDIKDEPGRASMIDCAFFAGDSCGTLEAYRRGRIGVESGASDRGEKAGRNRAAPVQCSAHSRGQLAKVNLSDRLPMALRARRIGTAMLKTCVKGCVD